MLEDKEGWIVFGVLWLGLAGYQCLIGDRCGHDRWEQRLPAPELASLPHLRLHQAAKAVNRCLPYLAIL